MEKPIVFRPIGCRPITGRRRMSVGMFGIVFGQVEISDRDGTRWVRAKPEEWSWCQFLEAYENHQKGIQNANS